MAESGSGHPTGAVRAPRKPDPAWLAKTREEIIDPDIPIIDTHHHFYDRPGYNYELPELLEDIGSGHDMRGTVYIDAGMKYRSDGPEAMKPVGEVEYVAAISEKYAKTKARLCAGIMGFADFMLGAAAGDVLDAEIEAGQGHFRGTRFATSWDPDKDLQVGRRPVTQGMLLDPTFRIGFAELAKRKLSFDAWIFHPQHGDLLDLARAFPETIIVMDHIGGLLQIGPYAGKFAESAANWKRTLKQLAVCPNIFMKLGGLGMPFMGYDFHSRPAPASSKELAEAWHPVFEPCIDIFGPERCMFESNIPPDKQTAPYAILWNAFKRIAAPYSDAEKRALLAGTAKRAYRLDVDLS